MKEFNKKFYSEFCTSILDAHGDLIRLYLQKNINANSDIIELIADGISYADEQSTQGIKDLVECAETELPELKETACYKFLKIFPVDIALKATDRINGCYNEILTDMINQSYDIFAMDAYHSEFFLMMFEVMNDKVQQQLKESLSDFKL